MSKNHVDSQELIDEYKLKFGEAPDSGACAIFRKIEELSRQAYEEGYSQGYMAGREGQEVSA